MYYDIILIREAAKDIELLKRLGITHIVNGASTTVHISELYYQHRSFMCSLLALPIGTAEEIKFRISDYFEEAARFIDCCLRKSSGKILIHDDDNGVTSGPILLIAYLMIKRELDVLNAVKIVRYDDMFTGLWNVGENQNNAHFIVYRAKRHIQPHDGFLTQLVDLDKKLKDRRMGGNSFSLR